MPNGNSRLTSFSREAIISDAEQLARQGVFVPSFLRDIDLGALGIDERSSEVMRVQTSKKETATHLRNKETGNFINSKRTFGVEYEINFDWKKSQSLRSNIAPEYIIEHDGSVRNGLEIVSPVLQGSAGESQVVEVCGVARDLGGHADDSCGLHVHFGGEDFFTRENCRILPLSKTLSLESQNKKEKDYHIIIHDSVISSMLNSDDSRTRDIASIISQYGELDFFAASYLRDNVLNKYGNLSVVFSDAKPKQEYRIAAAYKKQRSIYGGTYYDIQTVEIKEIPDITTFRGKPHLVIDGGFFSDQVIVNSKVSENLRVFRFNRKPQNASTERLKRLLSFYIAFDDVIAAMLPRDRRDNDFARRLNQKVSIDSIADCDSVFDIFKIWNRSDDDRSINSSGRNGRHPSRYCGINIHSLLKHGTIEIRYLAGTLDHNEILNWIALHHAIIDGAADLDNPRFRVANLQKASTIVRVEHKADLFFKKLKLRPDIEEYFRQIMYRYQNDDIDIVSDCIEMDIPKQAPSINVELADDFDRTDNPF
jgi:hypothetical protein